MKLDSDYRRERDSVFDLPCECNLCEPEQSFWCKGCRLENVPYCLGQDDDYFDYCTPCWYQLTHNLITVVVR